MKISSAIKAIKVVKSASQKLQNTKQSAADKFEGVAKASQQAVSEKKKTSFFGKIGNMFKKALPVLSKLSPTIQVTKSAFSNTVSAVKNTATAVKSAFSNIATNVKSAFSNIATNVKSAFSDIATKFKSAFSDIATKVKSAFSDVVTKVKSAFSGIVTKVKSAFSNIAPAVKKVATVAKGVLEAFKGFSITKIIEDIVAAVKSKDSKTEEVSES